VVIVLSRNIPKRKIRWSLFNLTEQIQAKFPVNLPFETHLFWKFSPEEYEQPFECRVVLVSSTGTEVPSRPMVFQSNTPRFRARVIGLPTIENPGEYQIRVDWRRPATENWVRCDSFWPLTIEDLPQGSNSNV